MTVENKDDLFRIEDTVKSIKFMCDEELRGIKDTIIKLEDENSKLQEENCVLEERAHNAEHNMSELSKKLNHIIGFINAGQTTDGIKNAFPKKDYLLGDDWGSHIIAMGSVQLDRLERFYDEELVKKHILLKRDLFLSLDIQNLDWDEDELSKRECVILFLSGDDIETNFKLSDRNKDQDETVKSDNEKMIEENVKEFVDLVDFFKDIGKDLVIITPGLRDTRLKSGSEKKGLIASAYIRFGEEIEKLTRKSDCIMGVLNLAKIMHKEKYYYLKKGDSKRLNEAGVTFVWKWIKETLQVLSLNVAAEEETNDRRRKMRVSDASADQCLRCWELGHHARDCHKKIDPCYRCGSSAHVSEACNAVKNKCEECGGIGHYKRVCPAAMHKSSSHKKSRYDENQDMTRHYPHTTPNEVMAEVMNQFKASMNNFMGQAIV